jgi:magnesium chelatase subunit I
MNNIKIKTLGELKASGYKSVSSRHEMRNNLIRLMQEDKTMFGEVKGYENSVIPQLQTAILSRHNIIFLGLRGQAKTRLARLMLNLLDEYIPVVEGSEINDDPLNPLSKYARELLKEKGDDTPIAWIHRSERYTEKLATPDVSVADLIGDLDPIKAAAQRLSYSDESVIHFGLIPRSNRGIFVINELPDLQARIQVALFNILQEGDIQIRGFKVRLPLDIIFVFTANPEDYTNRGSIVTPLKDRIDSQILTHYPRSIQVSGMITEQEARIAPGQKAAIQAPALVKELVEQVAFEARGSEYVDQKSGVSARLSISAMENLYSTAERRMLLNREKQTSIRISDFCGIISSITGKVELVYEGEVEGIANVAFTLIGKAIRSLFITRFPDPAKAKKMKGAAKNPYQEIIQWFADGNSIDLLSSLTDKEYTDRLKSVPGLQEVVETVSAGLPVNEKMLMYEFVLHGLAEFSQISKHSLQEGTQFSDLMSSMLNLEAFGEN